MAEYRVEELEPSAAPLLCGVGAFYHAGFVRAAAEVLPGRVELHGVYAGQALRALFPLYLRGGRAVIPPLAQYWGLWPLLPDDLAAGRRESVWQRIVEAVDAYLADRGPATVHFRHPPRVVDGRPLQQCGWRVTPRYTYLVRESAAAGFSSSTRRQLKKARGLDLRLVETRGSADLYRLHVAGMRVQRLRPAPRRLVEALAERGFLLEARRGDGGLAAGVLATVDDTAGYYQLAAHDPAGRGDGSPSLVVEGLLRRLTAQDRTLDFVGANTPAICRFKRGFGGRLTPYLESRRVYRPWRKLLARLRRFRGRD